MNSGLGPCPKINVVGVWRDRGEDFGAGLGVFPNLHTIPCF
jgi:hypothetical protein